MSGNLSPQRICYVAASCSTHTKKWCDWFSGRGHDVHVVTFDDVGIDSANVHSLELSGTASAGDPRKIAYLSRARRLRQILDEVQPDIIHAHYASSYGTLAAIGCKQPYYLSMWGSDIYTFPRMSPLHRFMLQFSLSRASWLMSTSNAMAEEARRYTSAPIEITPFGVDTSIFFPDETHHEPQFFTVGTVKGLKSVYGIDTLLRGCAHALKLEPLMPLRIRIAGKGSEELNLRVLAKQLGLADRIEWLGFVDPVGVPAIWNSLDLALIPSNSESFGVAAIEAQSCGVPVITSTLSGLLEATDPEANGMAVAPGDYAALGEVIAELYRDPAKRTSLGCSGRDFAVKTYDIDSCFERVERVYARNLR